MFSVEALRMQMTLSPSNEGILSNFLPRLFKNAQQAFANVANFKVGAVPPDAMSKTEKKRAEHLAKQDFTLMRERAVVALEGFTGKYLDYSQECLTGLRFYDEVLSESLKVYKRLLGELITNKTAQLNLRDMTDVYKKAEKVRLSQENSQREFWTEHSFNSEVKVGDVLDRMSDVTPLFENVAHISVLIKNQDLKNILERVNEVNSLVNILVETFEGDELKNISRAQINNLAEGIISLAKDIEHYALQHYRATIFVVAVARLSDALA